VDRTEIMSKIQVKSAI